ncbi:DUF979 domain-containing protein [Nevskia soli]|uniref:DUF979 domain-containing protein n=1 Tax=Nevskia soli TaxID=418856 RepID=UPI0004A6FFDC|nr:DUF979 family protein [Nevskia soli]
MSALVSQHGLFVLIGVIVLLQAAAGLRDRGNANRWIGALFWGLFSLPFLFGDTLVESWGPAAAYRAAGIVVVALALLAGSGRVRARGELQQRPAPAPPPTFRLLTPALLIPVVTLLCVTLLAKLKFGNIPLLDTANPTLTALGVAGVCALLAGWALTGGTPLLAVSESRRLFGAAGDALVLPQMLAMLGGVFIAAHTGDAVQHLAVSAIGPGQRLLPVVIYGLGMALFTMVMGNAFAAFPVMSAGIALPYLIQGQGAQAAPLLAIGMCCGYCGTLLTPMAANFNMVPAALLDLRDRYKVIKVQAPTALCLLAINIALIYCLAFR